MIFSPSHCIQLTKTNFPIHPIGFTTPELHQLHTAPVARVSAQHETPRVVLPGQPAPLVVSPSCHCPAKKGSVRHKVHLVSWSKSHETVFFFKICCLSCLSYVSLFLFLKFFHIQPPKQQPGPWPMLRRHGMPCGIVHAQTRLCPGIQNDWIRKGG